MFGSSGFGGFGQQNQQNQQQQQQPQTGGLFGQQQQNPAPGGFGGSGGFGSTGGFGATQTPAQPTGGLFGQQPQQQSSTPGFGGFGAANNTASTTGAFGARPAASTGFGGFGASNTASNTGSFTFGANANQPPSNAATGGFGSSGFGANTNTGGGLFGAQQQQPQAATGGFGSAPGAFGQPAGAAPGQITQGTATVPYDPVREDLNPTEPIKDRKNWDVEQAITVMPAYSQYSIEELRLMDYQQGRSKGNVGPGATGATGTGFGFGTGANPSTGGAFGQPHQTNTGFGATQPATGGGLFGQPQQQQQSGGLFGQQSNQQQSGGLFGAKPATTGFGATSTTGGGLFGQQQNQPQQSGGLFGQSSTQPTSSFSFGSNNQQQQQQPASTGFTFGAANTQQQQQNKPAFGFGSAQQPAQPGATGFGFGAANNQQQQPGQQASTGFGTGSTGGGFSFGAKPATGGLFGGATSQPGQTAGASSTFGAFGASSAAGTQQNKPAFSFGTGGGGFGATSTTGTGTAGAPSTGGLFGGGASTQPSGGLFGGAAGTGTGTTGGFSFGGNNQQQNQQAGQAGTTGGFGSAGGLFGAKPAGQTGTQTGAGGLFGGAGAQTGQQQAGTGFGASTGGGLFGSTANKPAGAGFSFGTGGGSSLFGGAQNNQQQNQQQPGGLGTGFGQTQGSTGGLFGQSTQQGQTGGGLFGSGGGSSLFGGAGSTTGGGLFGSTSNNQGGGGLFGGLGQNQQNQQSGGLFGQQSQQQQQQQQQPTVQASLDTNPYGTDSLFAANPVNGQAGANGAPLPFNVASKNKPPLITPFRSSPRAANKINRLRGSTPGASGLSSSFAREVTPGSFREGTPGAHARFGTPGRAGSPALFKGLSDEYSQPLSSQAFVSRPSAKRLVLDDTNENSFTSARIGRSGSVPQFESGSSPATGSLVGSAFRSRTVHPSSAASATRVTFSPALEQRAESVRPGGADLSFASSLPSRRGNLFSSSPSVVDETPLKTASAAAAAKAAGPRQGRDLESSFATTAAASTTSSSAPVNGASAETAKAGEYYTEPSLSALRTANYNELKAVHNFIVGRKGVGRIEFLEPVDLTSIGDLNDIVGGIVQIRLKEVVVYPEEDDYDPRNPKDGAKRNFVPGLKAKQGTGLNVPARVSLEACWPTDRATREPIKDANHPRVKQMINKLKNKPETEFVDFEAESGTWTFKVKHFSRYGLDDSDEEDQAPPSKVQKANTGSLKKAAPSAPAQTRLAPLSMDEESLEGDEEDGEEDDGPPPLKGLDDTEDSGMEDDDADDYSVASSRVARTAGLEPRAASATPSVARSATPSRAMSALGNGAEARRVQVMQASFFGQDDSKLASGAVVPSAAATTGANKTFKTISPRKTLNNRPSAGSVTSKPPSRFTQTPQAAVISERSTLHPVDDAEPDAESEAQQKPLTVSQRPAKKLRKMDLAKSSVKGAEGETLDAGLSLGRSFRVGWGPDGTLVHNGKLVGANFGVTSASAQPPVAGSTKARDDDVMSATTSTLVMERFETFKGAETAKTEAARAEKLLKVQLNHTIVDVDDEGVPVAYTDFGTRFRHFVSSFEHKDRSFEACLWRLGVALFDEIELKLPEGTPTNVIERIKSLRRKAALSNWLRHTIAGTVETEARSHIAASRGAALLFTYLTGHQIERACNAALEGGDLRLATLIAQAGGDEEARADISEQLLTWRKEGVDAHIQKDHRKIYEILSGNVLISKGTDSRITKDPIDQVPDLRIGEGLDWKRAFGLFLWYESPFEAPLEHAFERYEAQISSASAGGVGVDNGIAVPLPWYRESSSLGALRLKKLLQQTGGYDRDALFELIKLYTDPTYGLESTLNACGFGPSNADSRLPWHLYNLLSRVMQVRDFHDRVELGVPNGDHRNNNGEDDTMGVDVGGSVHRRSEGNSARADTLASSYATQLELAGMWQWSAFVLLHLELSESREAAIKALLSRHVFDLDEHRDFLCTTLKIPEAWLFESKAYLARARDNRYEEYRLLLQAKSFTAAHDVAARHLAPEAVVTGDHELLSVLFSPFYLEMGEGGDPADAIPGWDQGGALYIDYVAMSRETPLLGGLLADPSTKQLALDKIKGFSQRIPTLLAGIDRLFPQPSSPHNHHQQLPSTLTTKVARTEMIAGIHNLIRILVNLTTKDGSVESLTKDLVQVGSGNRSGGWDPAVLEVENVQSSATDYLASLLKSSASMTNASITAVTST